MKEKVKKFIGILLVIVIFSTTVIYGATNKEYGGYEASIDITEGTIENNLVLDYIGQFIFAIGNIFQSVTSWIMGIFTGESVFPWADKVIFNTIPLLDVNFINPDRASLFSDTNEIGIGEIIRNVYFTALSISLGLMGLIIAALAIRLAISSIGSEKAKYKEAIVTWLTSLVLLFGMHYFISFVFYMNEQLTIVASKILSNTIQENSENLEDIIQGTLGANKQRVVLNFCNSAIESAAWAEAYSWMTPIGWVSNGIQWLAGAISGDDENAQKVSVAQSNAQYLMDNYEITYMLISDSTIREYALSYIKGNSENNWLENIGTAVSGSIGGIFGYSAASTEIGWMKDTVEYIKGGISETAYNSEMQRIENVERNYDSNSTEYKAAQLSRVINTYAYQYRTGTLGQSQDAYQIIGQLGEYFKSVAWYTDVNEEGWSPSSVSIIGATLYTIFIFQSISFFISYLKRLFMVVILAILAPFVVIFEFFKKSTFGASKGGIINAWLRELCTLIFVQTFHAFLLAIIMSIIVRALAGTYASTMQGSIEAVGLLAIFALLALPRLELLIKNIFGLTSGVADTSLAGGQKSLSAGGLLAFAMGKRLLDNPRKVAHGVRTMIGSAANNRRNRFKDKNAQLNEEANNTNNALNEGQGETRRIAGANTGTSSRAGVGGGIGGNSDNLTTAIQSLTDAINTQNRDKQKDSFKDGAKETVKGLAETLAAVPGAIAGATISAGFNKNVISGAITGAGVGDKIGETVVNVATEIPSTVKDTGVIAKGIASDIASKLTSRSGKNNSKGNDTKNVVNNIKNTTNTNVKNTINTTVDTSSATGSNIDTKDLSENILKEIENLKREVNDYKKTSSISNSSNKEISKQISESIKKTGKNNRLDNKRKIDVDDL